MASLIPVRYQANTVEILIYIPVDLRVGGGWKSNNHFSYGYGKCLAFTSHVESSRLNRTK